MINIIPETPIRLTREESEQYRREYDGMVRYMVDPPSFETFVRRQKQQRDEDRRDGADAIALALSAMRRRASMKG